MLSKTNLAKRGIAGVLIISQNSTHSKLYEKVLQSIVFPRRNVLSHLCFEAAIQILPGSGTLWSNLSTLIFQSGLVGRLLKQKSFQNVHPWKQKL